LQVKKPQSSSTGDQAKKPTRTKRVLKKKRRREMGRRNPDHYPGKKIKAEMLPSLERAPLWVKVTIDVAKKS